jgi:hypothetical protein
MNSKTQYQFFCFFICLLFVCLFVLKKQQKKNITEAPAWKICLGYMQSHPEVFADLTLDEWTAVVQSRNTLVSSKK